MTKTKQAENMFNSSLDNCVQFHMVKNLNIYKYMVTNVVKRKTTGKKNMNYAPERDQKQWQHTQKIFRTRI